MNVADKLKYAKAHINSISRHDDEDAAVRKALLADLKQHITAEVQAIDARTTAKAAAMLNAAAEPKAED